MVMKRDDPRWAPHTAMSPVLREMLKHDIPLTRENWISVAHAGAPIPDPWTAEDEMMVPEPFHDPDFEANNPPRDES